MSGRRAGMGWILAVMLPAWPAVASEPAHQAGLPAPDRVSRLPVAPPVPGGPRVGPAADVARLERRITWQPSTPYPDLAAAWHAVNRDQGFRAYVASDGIRISPREGGPAAWDLRLDVAGLGRDGVSAPPPPPVISVDDAEIVLDRGALVERLRNEERGFACEIEIPSRPMPDGAGPLQILVRLSGALSPVIAADASAVTLRRPGGAAALAVRGLEARDGAARRLPARFSARHRDGRRELVITVDDREASYPLTVEALAGSPQWSAEGDQYAALFSIVVAPAGDVNGDGFGDVLAGSHLFDNGEADEGRAFLYLGSAAGLASSPAWTAEGNQVQAYFGGVVTSAGDVNGDGFDDVVIGAFGYDNGEADEGRAHLYLGSVTGLGTTPAWIAEGGQALALFGGTAAAAGDVNGDGFGDVIVGADWYSNGQVKEGRAYLYLGSAAGLGTAPAWVGESNQAGAQYGFAVAGAGDVNGDGYSDVIVAAVLYDNGEIDEGRTYLYYGSAAGLASAPGWVGEPDSVVAEFGFSIAGAGDVDGDGFSDVLIGAVLDDEGGGPPDEGKVFLYRGSPAGLGTDPAWVVNGGQPGAELGFCVAAAEDVNGDGFSDVVIGATGYQDTDLYQGRVLVFQGSPGGLAHVPSWTKEGDQFGARLGWSVAAADVDGDGYGDVIAGAPLYDRGHIDEGKAYLYRGGPSGPSTTASWSVSGGQESAFSATALAFAGDVNGDGYEDVVVGAPGYDNGEAEGGRALLFLGSALGLAPAPAWERDGGQAGAAFGQAISGAGDVNGDGYADVVIGAPGYDGGFVDGGRATLHLGGPSGLTAAPAWVVTGDQAGAHLGAVVAWAGDLNGDGYADLAVAAPARDAGGTDAGAVFVYYGSGTGPRSSPVTLLTGGQAGAAFGAAIAPAFDVDDDSFGDLLIGAPGFDNGETDEGSAYVFRGSRSGVATTPVWSVEGGQAGAACGAAVAGVGDVDGDGYADLMIGMPYLDLLGVDAGYAALYLGAPGGPATAPSWNFLEPTAGSHLGSTLSRAGDVDGDGFADFLISAPDYDAYGLDAGEAFLFYGSASGPGAFADWRIEGVQPYERLAAAVSGGGDVNADGYADVLVGLPGKSELAVDEGEARLYLGNAVLGAPLLPRQRRAGGPEPVLQQGSSGDLSAFVVEFRARAVQGASHVRPEWEIKPAGVPFDGVGTVLPPAWIESTAGVSLASYSPTGLAPDTPYHWRARLRSRRLGYALEAAGRWFSSPWNAGGEADLRTAAPPAGEVDDTSLLVQKVGATLNLFWGSSCAAGDADYEVYEGVLGSFASHVPRICATGGARSITLIPSPGNRYYLVVPTSGYREGSYGLRSDGTPRPQGAGVCRPQAIASCP